MGEPNFRPYWVLYIDLAGFSDFIRDRQSRDAIARAYSDILSDLQEGIGPVGSARPVAKALGFDESVAENIIRDWRKRLRIFSDSIFLFFDSVDDPVLLGRNPSYLFPTAAEISRELWARELPHRGGIAYGDCWLDDTGTIFVGDAIVRAYRWEQEQEWFGISVEPSSTQRLETILGRRDAPAVEYTVDAKAGPIPAVCVNPTRDIIEAARVDMLSGFDRAYQNAVRQGPLSAIAKYVRTARFFMACGIREASVRRIAGAASG